MFISSVNNATNFPMFKRYYNFDFNALAFSIVEILKNVRTDNMTEANKRFWSTVNRFYFDSEYKVTRKQ